jgi:membrane protease YdiL (CAAX protease family)
MGTAVFCLLLAIVDGKLMPGPENAPIDEAFRKPEAAWFMVFFGILLAPFFEEMLFRGFLVPAFCTAYDWCAERITKRPAPWPDEDGKTVWTMPAMVTGSILVSIPFAMMHGAQTGYSLGPFLLLFCVSLVLCWVRLSLRSLAASTLVHASYNLLLFAIMIAGTDGFRHLDKLLAGFLYNRTNDYLLRQSTALSACARQLPPRTIQTFLRWNERLLH